MPLKTYWQFIEEQARYLGSDGCTVVSEWHRECCFEHDLACHYKKDPRSAYAHYTYFPGADEPSDWWALADPMSRREADYAFARCNYDWSYNTQGRIRSFIRFLGVRLGAFFNIGGRKPKDLT